MVRNITETLADFSSNLEFEDLPADVVHETKRILLDTVGIALGSLDLDKGRIAIKFGRMIGGAPESTILGSGEKVAASTAAFVNGELIHSMDYCSLLAPAHVSAYVTPAPLALAEVRNASGKDLITAVALAHEIASRVGASMGPLRAKSGGLPPRSWGFGGNAFGAAAGTAGVMNLDGEKMVNAFGLAGCFAPVPSQSKQLQTLRNGMQKYGPAGWTAQGGVTAALLAEMGERGDRQVLDGDYGFWAMSGSDVCDWDVLTRDLGVEWNLRQVEYEYWPCCGTFQSSLGTFVQLINDNELQAEEIQQVMVETEGQILLPLFQATEIDHHVDAQSSPHYNFAVAAHRIKRGPAWQARSTIENPDIREFMKKVSFRSYPKAEESRLLEIEAEGRPYINKRPVRVEVIANGKRFVQEAEYANWLSGDTPEYRATDEGLAEKFRNCASATLEGEKIEEAIETIMNLEKIGDANELLRVLVR